MAGAAALRITTLTNFMVDVLTFTGESLVVQFCVGTGESYFCSSVLRWNWSEFENCEQDVKAGPPKATKTKGSIQIGQVSETELASRY
jgi:hypothetical protein